jgi:hypothetical protein
VKRRTVTLQPSRKATDPELEARRKRDPDMPEPVLWVVFDSMGTSFWDDNPEGATALAKQYHRMK